MAHGAGQQSVFEAVGGKFAPVAPEPHFLKKEADIMEAAKIAMRPGVSGAHAHQHASGAHTMKAVAAASGAGMWVLVGSIGIICVCAVYVMVDQHSKFAEMDDGLQELERKRLQKKHGVSAEDMEDLAAARSECRRIHRESGQKVLGVYPAEGSSASWTRSLSDTAGRLVSLAGGHDPNCKE
eukprot:TRINITY_DN35525_c0_g1_i1.p1 TRINITY_DN35525_c0_g1~~TRINITY_DN35525_c0_g1_i1.p1  ORF type:complete len:182 (+),score=25.62 TRINITY_DN35525_c0_g1_i1:82-627(+)